MLNDEIFKKWLVWIRNEQMLTGVMNVSYMPDESADYRRGRIDGLRSAESHLGMLMLDERQVARADQGYANG